MSDETIYYQDPRVQITNARAVIDSKTYSMANITSVHHLRQPPKRLWPGVMVVLGGVGVITGLILVLNGESPACLGFGAVLAVAGVLLWMASKTQYLVIIGSASGETQALRSTDQGYVEKVVAAMNEAIVQRG